MALVGQLTPFTCVLACLESFFKDIGFAEDQCGILSKLPILCLNLKDPSAFGAVNQIQLMRIADALGFDCSAHRDFRMDVVEACWSSLQPNQGVLISLLWDGKDHHCVRFLQIVTSGEYAVMNPQFLNPHSDKLTFQQLVDWNFEFFVLTRK